MARADLLCELIKYGLVNDSVSFRKAAEAICAEERSKQHTILANKIEEMLKDYKKPMQRELFNKPSGLLVGRAASDLFIEKQPQKSLDHLIFPKTVIETSKKLIAEQNRSDLLQSYGVEPRNKILLVGPPGNGKTSLAEAIAEALMVPLLTVRYESLIGSYLGETAGRLSKLFEYAKTRECVLFFDEFETIGKERGDVHETGEIKRVVSSLLMQIDDLPSYVVVIAATNHASLLDQAAWRRFQIRMEIPKPTRLDLEEFYRKFEQEKHFSFGMLPGTLAKKTMGISYSEAEEIALSVFRQYILEMPTGDVKLITENVLRGEQMKAEDHGVNQKGDTEICQKDQ